MASHLVSRHGVPVIAGPSSPEAPKRLCRLFVQHTKLYNQATISLQFALPSKTEDAVVLLYDVDNLIQDESSLTNATEPLSSDQLEQLARGGHPELYKLCLSLHQLCPISCSSSLTPQHGDRAFIQHVFKVAGAKKVHILFDGKWVHHAKRALLQRIIDRPQDLTGGLPTDLPLYCLADWSAAFCPWVGAESEAPPTYSAASKKRSIPAAAKSTRDPARKRALKSADSLGVPSLPAETSTASPLPYPTVEHPPLYNNIWSPQAESQPAFPPRSPSSPLPSAPLECPGSPTEKATTVASPSPKPWSSPVVGALDLKRTIYNAVQELLPQVVREALPGELARLLSAPETSPSASQSSMCPDKAPNTFSRLVRVQLASVAKDQLREFENEASDQVDRLRTTAVEEFNEVLEEKKTLVEIANDDNITELDRVFAEKRAEFKDEVAEIADEVYERAYSRLEERSGRLIDEQQARLFKSTPLELDKRAASMPS